MSGSRRSTPRCSSRGNARPASTTMTSSAHLVDGHVLADLAEAAERDDPECVAHRRLSLRTSPGRDGYAATGASRPSRSRQPRTASRSSSVASTSGSRSPPTSWPSRFSAHLIAIGFTTTRKQLDRRRELLVERPCALDVARAEPPHHLLHLRADDVRVDAHAAACPRARGTGRRGRRRRRRGRGRARRCARACSRSGFACFTARTVGISASCAIVSVSRLSTTRAGML